MPQNAKRGFMPTDGRDFSAKMLPTLRKAAGEVFFLLNRGYPMTPVTRFIGDHYQLSERQRLALARTVSPRKNIYDRKQKELSDIRDKVIYIDGFNIIITLEIAFSKSMLFECMDGTLRDLAGLHGTYRLIPETDLAIDALRKGLEKLGAEKAVIYLDRPVSNSGRLKQRICERFEGSQTETEVLIEDAVDTILKSRPLVSTADAVILDECEQWFDLVRFIIRDIDTGTEIINILPQKEDMP